MNIELVSGKYKSIKSLKWDDIPEFVVVTGKNGSGKTQLLELINYHFGTNEGHKNNVKNQVNNPFYQVKIKVENCDISDKEVVYLPSVWQLSDLGGTNASGFTQIIDQLFNQIIGSSHNAAYHELAQTVENNINKPKSAITKTLIQENLPIDYFDYIHKIQIHEGLSESFLTYHCKSAELRDNGKSESEIELEIGKAPWEIINDLLKSADFPYKVNKPKAYMGDYLFQLIRRDDPALIINFSDLSSGEKVLISLGIWMFNSGKSKRLPKLLLLDEPDAHLHPSAIKDFIEVIEKTLVKKFGVRVIITTHSPTTVSFAPEYSLFEMSKDEPQVRHIESKEYGINLLTEGLVVVKSNTKYVLVEDQNDADFYNTVFSILKNKSLVNIFKNVIFIPSSNKEAKTTGGCSVVKSWVEKFEKAGVFDAFQGLIDRDEGDINQAKNIHVLNRHSLENYLLDPILVYSSIIHDSLTYSIPSIEINHQSEHQITNLPPDKLQIIANHIFNEIQPLLSGAGPDELKHEDVKLSNGITLKYPIWFLNRRGHDIYAKFQSKYHKSVNYGNLIKALVRHEFIPNDLVNIFNEIQK